MINVHVCDMSTKEGQMVLTNLKRIGFTHIIQTYPMSNGVEIMVNNVIAEAQHHSSTGMIKKLAIWGHGGPGSQGVSRGEESAANADWAGIELGMLAHNQQMRDLLGRLWDVLDWNGWVEMRGCAVAAGVAGAQFLTILADIWGVKVYAGEVDQRITAMQGFELAWTGRVHVASPGMMGTSTFQGQITP